MIDQELLARFWKDFQLAVQEQDPSFPIVNPSDAARALMKCRNWIGTFTEASIRLSYIRLKVLQELKTRRRVIDDFESEYYAELLAEGRSAAILKTRELSQALIKQKASSGYNEVQYNIGRLEQELTELDIDMEVYESILKRLEKTTEWLIQYINWNKFELRMSQ